MVGNAGADLATVLVGLNRERMAGEIGNVVMTRLSRLGFDLCAAEALTSGAVKDRLHRAVDETDELVRLLRRIVVDGSSPRSRDEGTVAAVEVLVADAAERLQCSRRLRLHGDLDDVSEETSQVVRVVLREALGDIVATHSGVSDLQVDVSVHGARVDVMVTDDATAVRPAAGVGLQALETLADGLQGGFSYQVRTPRGTVVRWSVHGAALA